MRTIIYTLLILALISTSILIYTNKSDNSKMKQSFIDFLKSEIFKDKKSDIFDIATVTFDEKDITCDANSCSTTLQIKAGKETHRVMISYRQENNTWVENKVMQESQTISPTKEHASLLANEYNFCVSVHSQASVAVNLNDKLIISETNAEGTSTCTPIVPNVGKNNIEIVFNTLQNSAELGYSYDLRGAPKGTESIVFDDNYIISAKEFAKDVYTDGKKIINISFEAY